MLPPLGDCLVRLYARAGPAHRQIACSVRVPLCTCCALCAIKHMTPKHWCVRAAHEREEGVKTHRYAVLKGCRERDIVRRPLPFKLHQSYRPLPCLIPALQEIWSGPRKTVRWWRWWPQHRGWHLITAVKRLCGYRHSPTCVYYLFWWIFKCFL